LIQIEEIHIVELRSIRDLTLSLKSSAGAGIGSFARPSRVGARRCRKALSKAAQRQSQPALLAALFHKPEVAYAVA
jgi:hypothetical protein